MDIKEPLNIDVIKLHKMALIYNSLEDGWTVKKSTDKDVYIFTKKHGGKKEIFLDSYLRRFMEDNINIDNIINSNNKN
jgi:hypothetical protein|tara:strand:+ start:1043 stop:1276 length:234 start_codon:yes stop_codon:yes gene_type:complete